MSINPQIGIVRSRILKTKKKNKKNEFLHLSILKRDVDDNKNQDKRFKWELILEN